MRTTDPCHPRPDHRRPRRTDPRPARTEAHRRHRRTTLVATVLALATVATSLSLLATAGRADALGPHTRTGAGMEVLQFGASSVYPSAIPTYPEGPQLVDLEVRLRDVHHQCVKDLDILLVAPNGQATVLMSDRGDQAATPFNCYDVHSGTLTFSDRCAAFPDPIPAGARSTPGQDLCAHPSDQDAFGHQGDDWYVPGRDSAGFTARPLSDLAGGQPQGSWKLYVFDDATEDQGSIGSWELSYATTNHHPTAWEQHYQAHKGVPLPLALGGGDQDGDALTCTGYPSTYALGTMTGGGCSPTFTASPRAVGTESFSVRTVDPWSGVSEPAPVTITVVNRPPTASPVTVSVAAGASVALPLGGTDPDPGEAVSCGTPTGARLGTVSGSGCTHTYTAGAAGGTDTFTYATTDGVGGTATGQVTVTVVATGPVAHAKAVTVHKGEPTTTALTGTDPTGTGLTCQAPTATTGGKGTLAGTGCTRTFTAAPRTTGTDGFGYTVRNGEATSAPAAVTYTIANRAPVGRELELSVAAGDRAAVTLGGTDPDPGEGLALTCALGLISASPTTTTEAGGSVRGEGCNVTYTAPAAPGTDVFAYQVADGFGGIDVARVRITVTAPVQRGCTAADTPDGRYVCRAYLDLLGRPAEPSGKAYWVRKLASGQPRAAIIGSFTATNEYRTSVVRGIHRELLGTTPDAATTAQQAEALRTGVSPDVLRAGVLGSDAWYAQAGRTSAGFAAGLHQRVLRRPATAAEVAAIEAELASGTTRQAVAARVLAGRDGDTVVVATAYERFLRRSPPAAETTYWVGRFQRGDPELVLVRLIIASDEYYANA